MVWNADAEAIMRKGLPPPDEGQLTARECELYAIPRFTRIEIPMRDALWWVVAGFGARWSNLGVRNPPQFWFAR